MARRRRSSLPTFAILQPVLHVLAHGHVREERVVLEDGVDVALVGRQVGHVATAQLYLSLVRPLEAGDHA